MNLNDLMKKAIKNTDKEGNKNINIAIIQVILALGLRIVLIYLFFIFTIGKYLAKYLGYNNLFFTSIIIGTLFNIFIIYNVIKDLNVNKN